jgi:hypothetical protein
MQPENYRGQVLHRAEVIVMRPPLTLTKAHVS